MKVNLKDIKTSDYEIGLTKLIGKKVKEIHGYLTTEFDDPVFKMTEIEFEDKTKVYCGGEHDMPYIEDLEKQPNGDYDTLLDIIKQDPDYEEEE